MGPDDLLAIERSNGRIDVQLQLPGRRSRNDVKVLDQVGDAAL